MRSRHVALTFAANLLIQATGIATGVLTARLLGPEQRGQLATITLYPLLFTSIGMVGLDQAVALQICRDKARAGVVGMSALVTSACLGMLLVIAAYVAMPSLLGPSHQDLLHDARLFVWVIPPGIVAITLLGVDWGRASFKAFNVLRMLVPGGYLVLVLTLWLLHRVSVHTFMLASMASVFVACATRVGLLGPVLLRVRPEMEACRQILRTGRGLYLATFAAALTGRADQMFVSRMLSDTEMGLYVVAGTIAAGVMGAATAFSTVGFIATGNKKDPQAALDAMTSQFRHGMLVMVFCSIGLLAIIRPLIQVLLGAKFVDATGPACVLVGATFALGLTKMLQESLKAMAHWRGAAASEVVAVLVLMGVAGVLVPHHGMYGAAAASVMARAASLVTLLVYSHRMLGTPLRDFWGFNRTTARRTMAAMGRVLGM